MDIERNDSSQNLSEKEAFEIVDRSKTEFINNFIKDHIEEYENFRRTALLKCTLDGLKTSKQIYNSAKIQDVYTTYDKQKKEIKSKLMSYSPSSWNQSKRECIKEDVINQILDKQIYNFQKEANSALDTQKHLENLKNTSSWPSTKNIVSGAVIVVADPVIIYSEFGLPLVESLVTSLEITCISPYALYILGVVGISLGAWYVVSKCLN